MTTTPRLLFLPPLHPHHPSPCKKKSCRFYLKILFCLLFLLVYFAIFLQESINATKLKQRAVRQQLKRHNAAASTAALTTNVGDGGGMTNGVQKILGKRVNLGKLPHGASVPVEAAGGAGERGNGPQNVTAAFAAVPSPTASGHSMYEYSDELNAALDKEFADRNRLLSEECDNLELTNRYPPNAWEFFVSPGHNLVWCPVFKAASSIWLYYFNVLGGYNVEFLQRTKTPPLEMARKKFPRPTQEELADALATSTSFLIVREPFERLVSAYKNKFEGSRNKYYKQLGDRIIKKFRNVDNATGTVPVARNHRGPTFEEFARYIVSRVKTAGLEKMNEHWAPIYSFCSPCTINFSLIVKTETLERDSEYIWRQALVESLLFAKLPKKSKLRVISNRSMVDTKSVKLGYFSKLSVTLLEELLRIYEPDFQLFGYNSTAYHEVLTKNKQGLL